MSEAFPKVFEETYRNGKKEGFHPLRSAEETGNERDGDSDRDKAK